jgi:chromosome partitioning protein
MAIIVVSSLKGGVGKSTCALHLAHGLARAGQRTLLIDCDPSAHLSRYFVTTAKKLINAKEPKQAIESQVRQNLDLLSYQPHSDLNHTNQSCSILSCSLENLKQQYSYIVMDTAPDLSPATRSALAAANMVIVPLDESSMAIESLKALSSYLAQNPAIDKREVFALRSMLNKRASRTQALSIDALTLALNESNIRGESNSVTGFLKQLNLGLLETIIYRSELAHQLSYARKSSFDLATSTSLSADYYSLVSEILSILKSNTLHNQQAISPQASTRISSRAQAYRGA